MGVEGAGMEAKMVATIHCIHRIMVVATIHCIHRIMVVATMVVMVEAMVVIAVGAVRLLEPQNAAYGVPCQSR
jgi:hypothetical protein